MFKTGRDACWLRSGCQGPTIVAATHSSTPKWRLDFRDCCDCQEMRQDQFARSATRAVFARSKTLSAGASSFPGPLRTSWSTLMTDDLKLLKSCLETATHTRNVDWVELRQRCGWSGFALDHDRIMDPANLPAHALEYLIKGKASPMNDAIMIGVTEFLIEKSGRPDDDDYAIRRRLRDLDQITQNPANFVGYLAWAKGWFG